MKGDNRRGAVLVLAALLMVVVLSCLVVVVDISRIYVQKSELQTAADAAAIAGVIELAEGAPTYMVQDTAVTYGQNNKAGGQALVIATSDIRCGFWDDAASTYSDDSGSCAFSHNAVTVTTRAASTNSIPGILAGIFQIKATARAYAAYVGATKCIKPWAIPYVVLTKTLQPLNPDTLRNLDTADVRILKSTTEAQRTFELHIDNPPNTGNFGSLEIPTTDPNAPAGGGTTLYVYNIRQCNPTLIGPGDILDTQPGGTPRNTTDAIEDLCSTDGNYFIRVGTVRTCYTSDGTRGVPVKAALWSQLTDKGGGKFAVTVRQIVSFIIEKVDNPPGDAILTGHFLPYLTTGEITVTPTSTQRPILVK